MAYQWYVKTDPLYLVVCLYRVQKWTSHSSMKKSRKVWRARVTVFEVEKLKLRTLQDAVLQYHCKTPDVWPRVLDFLQALPPDCCTFINRSTVIGQIYEALRHTWSVPNSNMDSRIV
jgi:hypothetical protein